MATDCVNPDCYPTHVHEVRQYAVISICNYTQCKDILDVRRVQLVPNHCNLTALAPLTKDNVTYDSLLANQSIHCKQKLLYNVTSHESATAASNASQSGFFFIRRLASFACDCMHQADSCCLPTEAGSAQCTAPAGCASAQFPAEQSRQSVHLRVQTSLAMWYLCKSTYGAE